MTNRPPMIRDKDTIEFRLTEQSESRLPFVFVETLDEATLAERSPSIFEAAARDRRLIHVVNRSTESILGTAMVQPSSDGKRPLKAEVGGLAVHPGARGFGIATHLLKVMMVYTVKESGRTSRTSSTSAMLSRATSPRVMLCSAPGFGRPASSNCTGTTSTPTSIT